MGGKALVFNRKGFQYVPAATSLIVDGIFPGRDDSVEVVTTSRTAKIRTTHDCLTVPQSVLHGDWNYIAVRCVDTDHLIAC